jgi:glyoxylase-like metal-dependent hydrolase (beta-lactamase superfamily II)
VDHVGNARSLQRIAGAEVCAHEDDIPYITGEAPRPGPPLRRLIDATLGRRTNTLAVDRVLRDGHTLDFLRVLHLPGHTPGHIGLQHGAVLFSGDTVVGGRTPRPAPRLLNWDQEQLYRSIARMATLDFDLLLPGHGTPVNDGPALCAALSY